MLGILVFFLVSLITYYIWQRTRKLALRDELEIPGPPISFVFGNMHQVGQYIKKNGKHQYNLFNDWINEYGDVYGFYLAGNLNVVVTDLDAVKEILVTNFNCFVDRMKMIMARSPPLRDSIVALKGAQWKQVRRALTPTFRAKKLKQMGHIMDAKIDVMMDVMGEYADSGETFDIYDQFQALTLDVIGECAFAMKVDCQRNFQDPFYVKCREFFRSADFSASRLLQFAVILPELDWVFNLFRPHSAMGKAEAWLTDGLNEVVGQRLRNYKDFASVDILQLLVEQMKEAEECGDNERKAMLGLSREEIVSNCFIFLLAGYETTSTALGYTAWLLAKHPEAQKKLQEELDAVLKDEKEPINFDRVQKMAYLDAVFHESLRVYPPIISFVIRSCVSECTVGKTRFVPGVQALIPVYNIHHNPEFWPEPEKFKPERFLGERLHHPMSWLPFGAGPRNCIGLRFADMEFKKALIRLLSKHTIVLGPDSEQELSVIQRAALLAPENGVKVQLRRRK